MEQLLKEIISRLDRIENNMITKKEAEKIIFEQQKDVIALLERTATKEDIAKIADTQSVHSEWLRTLAADTSQHTAEINLLKRAK
ncbi:MAG: hypothetical protein K0R78_2294 [Pelosinus sp.]|nr:hypothetical protein [Pelosinus sp.]